MNGPYALKRDIIDALKGSLTGVPPDGMVTVPAVLLDDAIYEIRVLRRKAETWQSVAEASPEKLSLAKPYGEDV